MANTLTPLAPLLFSAAQTVSQERFAALMSISNTFGDKSVAKGDVVRVPIAPVRAATDFVPAAVTSQGDDATATNVDVVISDSKKVSWFLTGEQQRSLQNGADDKEWARQLVLQGMRTLRNLAEAKLCTVIKQGASRAIGTAGTNPFATDVNQIPDLIKALKDNGAPLVDTALIIDTLSGANLRKLGLYQQFYQAGDPDQLRAGSIKPLFGLHLAESAGIGLHTKGTSTSATLTGSLGSRDATVGGTSIATVPGDIISVVGDTNKYVTGLTTSALGATPNFLNRPGWKIAPAAAALTVGNNYTANVAFERSAVVGIMRPPLIPDNATIQQLQISDDNGLTYLLLQIQQYGQVSWELHLAYGFQVVQQEHVAILLG